MTAERIDIIITEKGGKVVKRSIEDIGESTRKVDADISKLGKTAAWAGGIAGAALGGLAVALYKGFTNAARSIKETADASKQLGIGVENFSRWDFAARSANLTTEELLSTMQNLQKRQMEVGKNKEMAHIFKQLKIDALDANGALRETPEVLRELSNIFQRMPEGANKSALSMKLFGTENQKVISLLSQGTKGIDELMAKSDELGYTLSGQVAQDVSAFYDELDDVKLQIEAMYRQALPGLLPQIKEFSSLLNSPDFKEGFNAIIQGAAQSIIWMGKFLSTLANVTKFAGEEIAARTGGTDPRNTVRVEQRIERLKSTIADFKKLESSGSLSLKSPVFAIKAIYSPSSEATAVDLISSPSTVIARLNGELASEQNKLKMGIMINQDDAKAAVDAAKKTAEEAAAAAKSATAGVPSVDYTALTSPKGPRGKKGPDPAREMEQLERQLKSLLSAINPVIAAQLDLADANDTLVKAEKAGLITKEQAASYSKEYEQRLEDQLRPFEALTKEISNQIKVAGMLNDEREIEITLLGMTDSLTRSGVKGIEEKTDALRDQLKVLRETNELSAAKESILAGSQGEKSRKDSIDLKALEELKAQLTGTDKFNFLNQMLGGSLDETQMAFDAQIEQFQTYYGIIDQFRKQDVANEAIASAAKREMKKQEMDMYLSRTSDALGAAAGLMKSNSKEAFKVGQAAAIGQAIVNTYTAATAAYQSAAAIPFVGWVLGPLAAAGAIAAGMAQVSAIRSQTMPAYRTGGSMVVGGSGGTDSQVVNMRATPGEKININTPAQARALEKAGKQAPAGGDQHFNLTVIQQGKPDNHTPEQNAKAFRKQAIRMGG